MISYQQAKQNKDTVYFKTLASVDSPRGEQTLGCEISKSKQIVYQLKNFPNTGRKNVRLRKERTTIPARRKNLQAGMKMRRKRDTISWLIRREHDTDTDCLVCDGGKESELKKTSVEVLNKVLIKNIGFLDLNRIIYIYPNSAYQGKISLRGKPTCMATKLSVSFRFPKSSETGVGNDEKSEIRDDTVINLANNTNKFRPKNCILGYLTAYEPIFLYLHNDSGNYATNAGYFVVQMGIKTSSLLNARSFNPNLFHECGNNNAVIDPGGYNGLVLANETKGKIGYGIDSIVHLNHRTQGITLADNMTNVTPFRNNTTDSTSQLKGHRHNNNKSKCGPDIYPNLFRPTSPRILRVIVLVKCCRKILIKTQLLSTRSTANTVSVTSVMERQNFPGKTKHLRERKKAEVKYVIKIIATSIMAITELNMGYRSVQLLLAGMNETEKAVEGILDATPEDNEMAALKEFIDMQNSAGIEGKSVKESATDYEMKSGLNETTVANKQEGVSDFGYRIIYDPVNDELKRIPDLQQEEKNTDEIQMRCHIRCPNMEELEAELKGVNENPNYNEAAVARSQQTNPAWECEGSVLQQYYLAKKIKKERKEEMLQKTVTETIDLTEADTHKDSSSTEEEVKIVPCDQKILNKKKYGRHKRPKTEIWIRDR